MSKAEFSGIIEKVLVVAVTRQNGSCLQPVKARAALTFYWASHCTCLRTNSEQRKGSIHPGRPNVITGVFVFFLFLMSTSVPGVGKGLGTWSEGTGYTSAIAISLGNRKYFPYSMDEEIEAKGEMSKVFQGGEEPRALRLEHVTKYAPLALAGYSISFWEPSSSGDCRNTSC